MNGIKLDDSRRLRGGQLLSLMINIISDSQIRGHSIGPCNWSETNEITGSERTAMNLSTSKSRAEHFRPIICRSESIQPVGMDFPVDNVLYAGEQSKGPFDKLFRKKCYPSKAKRTDLSCNNCIGRTVL